jgi:hypothetical protein
MRKLSGKRGWKSMSLRLAPRCLAAMLLASPAVAQELPARSPGAATCERSPTEDAIASVSERGELVLASGRTVTLLDVRLPIEAEFSETLARLRALAGQRVTLKAPEQEPDRWSRIAADVTVLEGSSPVDLAGRLVADVLAMVDAGGRGVLCRPDLLAAEERALPPRRPLGERAPSSGMGARHAAPSRADRAFRAGRGGGAQRRRAAAAHLS